MMNPSYVMCGESAKGNSIWPLGSLTLHCNIALGTWWRGHAGMPSVRGRTALCRPTLAATRHIGKRMSHTVTGRLTRLTSKSSCRQISFAKGVRATPSGPTVTEGSACRFTMALFPQSRAQHLGASTVRVTECQTANDCFGSRGGPVLARGTVVLLHQERLSQKPMSDRTALRSLSVPRNQLSTETSMCMLRALLAS